VVRQNAIRVRIKTIRENSRVNQARWESSDLTGPSFCTSASERVYITAARRLA
jgi:hypothetical protein